MVKASIQIILNPDEIELIEMLLQDYKDETEENIGVAQRRFGYVALGESETEKKLELAKNLLSKINGFV